MNKQLTDINYKMMAGFLTLDKITPTINALFGPYIFKAKQMNAQRIYIKADTRIKLAPIWQDIHKGMKELLQEIYGVAPIEDIATIELIGLWDSYHSGRYELAECKVKLPEIIKLIDVNEAPDLTTLFLLAQHFNDGHGLKKLVAREYTLISDPEWGNNLLSHYIYASDQLLNRSGGDDNERSEILSDCLEADDIESTGQLLLLEVESILCSIIGNTKRNAVRKELSKLLSLSSSLDPKYIN